MSDYKDSVEGVQERVQNETKVYHELADIIDKAMKEERFCSGIGQMIHDQIFNIIVLHNQKLHAKQFKDLECKI